MSAIQFFFQHVVQILTVCHEAEEVNAGLHCLGVKPSQIPVIRGQRHTDAVIASERGSHFPYKHGKVPNICQLIATPRYVTWIFPIQINAGKPILEHETVRSSPAAQKILFVTHQIHVILDRAYECSTIRFRRNHVAPVTPLVRHKQS